MPVLPLGAIIRGMKNEWIKPKEVLEILAKRQAVSELGFWNWLNSPRSKGIVAPRIVPHGRTKWHEFRRGEIIALEKMLPPPADRIPGKAVFPDATK